jgi:hypothetical protein
VLSRHMSFMVEVCRVVTRGVDVQLLEIARDNVPEAVITSQTIIRMTLRGHKFRQVKVGQDSNMCGQNGKYL